MLDVLADNPVLTLFLVVGLGWALVLVVVGAGTLLLGRLLDLSAGFQGGAFAGVGTSTPTLAAVGLSSGSAGGRVRQ